MLGLKTKASKEYICVKYQKTRTKTCLKNDVTNACVGILWCLSGTIWVDNGLFFIFWPDKHNVSVPKSWWGGGSDSGLVDNTIMKVVVTQRFTCLEDLI